MAMNKGGKAMKRTTLWVVGFVAASALLWLGFEGSSSATHDGNAGYSRNNYIGEPGDATDDYSPEVTGFDRNSNDRTPDATPDGVNQDSTPDCGNGPGDGNCGNSPFSGDSYSDHGPGPGDGVTDETPDLFPASGFNRVGENITDASPERTNSETYRIDHGLAPTDGDRVGGVRDCIPADVALGECDRATNLIDDSRSDVVGRDGNATAADRVGTWGSGEGVPDRAAADIAAGADDPGKPNRDGDSNGSDGSGVPDRIARPNADGTPDSTMSRTDREYGYSNHAQPGRDVYSTGPADYFRDARSDIGGFGFGGAPSGGGGGGCSMVAARTTTTGSGLAYLLVLFAPVAVVLLRRFGRR
jgi:hypothetical protein